MDVNKIWFDMIKKYYDLKFYTNEDVKIFVANEQITAEQYKTITNIEYVV